MDDSMIPLDALRWKLRERNLQGKIKKLEASVRHLTRQNEECKMVQPPNTNHVPDSIRGHLGHFLQADPFDKLQAVVDATLEALRRGDIDADAAGVIIEFGIRNAKSDMHLIGLQTDGRIYANASRNNVPDSVVEEAVRHAAEALEAEGKFLEGLSPDVFEAVSDQLASPGVARDRLVKLFRSKLGDEIDP